MSDVARGEMSLGRWIGGMGGQEEEGRLVHFFHPWDSVYAFHARTAFGFQEVYSVTSVIRGDTAGYLSPNTPWM